MKFGVREICDVVLRAKAPMKVGNKVFYKNEPVIYFDSLKTTTLEGASSTVYATGGRGNSRLVAWDGERTVTFTMEDALISPEGFMILSGAGLIDASTKEPVYQHITEIIGMKDIKESTTEDTQALEITLQNKPYLPIDKKDNFAYVMLLKNGEVVSEPFIPVHGTSENNVIKIKATHDNYVDGATDGYSAENRLTEIATDKTTVKALFDEFDAVLVDYYTERTENAKQIEITADKFGGNFYLEASTLFRDTNGIDMPAEFIIPNCKIQSNFTFTMASSGDPSTFTFTMDAFPDTTRFDPTKKVLFAIQMFGTDIGDTVYRTKTLHDVEHDKKIY